MAVFYFALIDPARKHADVELDQFVIKVLVDVENVAVRGIVDKF
jgi:hypothetical protein